MDINIRWIAGKYTDVIVSTAFGQVEAGMLTKKEREELAQKFQDAIDELLLE